MLWLLLLVLVVVLYQSGVFNQVYNNFPHGSGNNAQDKTALDVLDERYARGELSTDEYRQIKETLTGEH